MHAKTHRQNSNFQIAYFLAGSCHTPDGAYAVLCDLREERQMVIDEHHISQSSQIEKARSLVKRFIKPRTPKKPLKPINAELKRSSELHWQLYQAAVDELAFIQRCIELINPLRKYANLPDAEAHQAAQQEEWCLELIHRAENHMLTGSGIPPDQFAAMRMHPEFFTRIMPSIERLQKLLHEKKSPAAAIQQLNQEKSFDITKALPTNILYLT